MDRETADDIKRHLEVVAEGLRSEIRATDEKAGARFDAMERRFDAVDSRFEAVDRRFDAVDSRFEAIDRRFDAVDRRFDAVDSRLDAVDSRLDAADSRFHTVDRRFDELKRHFDVVGESLRSDIRLLAEGVTGLDEKFTREFVDVREEIGEVKTLLRVSYADRAQRDRTPS